MRPELLAPAGSPEALRAAVQNGAEDVYKRQSRIREKSPTASPRSLVRNTWAPREVSVSTMVRTVHQLSPTSLTTPTRAYVSSMTQSFTSTP